MGGELEQLSPVLVEELGGWGFAYQITSGLRSPSENRAVGGVEDSLHLTGEAVDFVPIEQSLEETHLQLLEMYPSSNGIGKYKTHIHFDVRERKARWLK